MEISPETKIRLIGLPSILYYGIPAVAIFATRSYTQLGKEAALIALGMNVAYQVGLVVSSNISEDYRARHNFKAITLCQAAVVALAARSYQLSLGKVIFCLGIAKMANAGYGMIEESFGWHNPRYMGKNFEDIDNSEELPLV